MLVPISVAAPSESRSSGSRLFEEKSHKSFKCKTATKALSGSFRAVGVAMTSLDLPERPRILVVTLRRLGDVLLTTPLIRTIRRASRGRPSTCWCFAAAKTSSGATRTSTMS